MKQHQKISPSQDRRTSCNLRRCTAAPVLPLDELIAPVENRSCLQKRSDPNGVAEPAKSTAGSGDPTRLGCQAFAPHRPAWGFPPASPASVHKFRSAAVHGFLASTVLDSRSVDRQSSCRFRRYLYWPSPAVMLLSGFLAHILPQFLDPDWRGVRYHGPPMAIQSPSPAFRGLHPPVRKESP